MKRKIKYVKKQRKTQKKICVDEEGISESKEKGRKEVLRDGLLDKFRFCA